MLSALLRVTHLHFEDDINPQLKELLKALLNNGDMVIE